MFSQPTVITVEKDMSVEIALDARELDMAIVDDKHQISEAKHIADLTGQQKQNPRGEVLFTLLGMQ